jgi:hypothetical protein
LDREAGIDITNYPRCLYNTLGGRFFLSDDAYGGDSIDIVNVDFCDLVAVSDFVAHDVDDVAYNVCGEAVRGE